MNQFQTTYLINQVFLQDEEIVIHSQQTTFCSVIKNYGRLKNVIFLSKRVIKTNFMCLPA
jgi:hypothetical protein